MQSTESLTPCPSCVVGVGTHKLVKAQTDEAWHVLTREKDHFRIKQRDQVQERLQKEIRSTGHRSICGMKYSFHR